MIKIFQNISASIRLLLYFIIAFLTLLFLFLNPFKKWRKYIKVISWKSLELMCLMKVEIEGKIIKDRPLLIISNHSSFWEIVAIGSRFNPIFTSKSEMRKMPFVGLAIAKAGGVFINRNPSKAVESINKMKKTLIENNSPLLVFAEGTTNNGNEILKFKSSMFSILTKEHNDKNIKLQPMVFYTKQRNSKKTTYIEREFYSYYVKPNPADEESFLQHMFKALKNGRMTVVIKILAPIDVSDFSDRKELSDYSEYIMREEFNQMIKENS